MTKEADRNFDVNMQCGKPLIGDIEESIIAKLDLLILECFE